MKILVTRAIPVHFHFAIFLELVHRITKRKPIGWLGRKCTLQKRLDGFVLGRLVHLIKQGWMLVTNLNSLLARVLKATYFPKSSFFGSSLGRKPSRVCRDIVWGREIFHKGIRLRIGNGSSTLGYKDKWILKPASFKEKVGYLWTNYNEVLFATDGGKSNDGVKVASGFIHIWSTQPNQAIRSGLKHDDQKGSYTLAKKHSNLL
ncbi:hypothetical protein Ddye_016183 [Dipteronia dyeriana]|uniref:Uncharacterized protein n=1 Tax=Dipteronia dyeriana TaxID=168575 RepID=A0AAD9U777_9ROSI|nr:hypothetical protein Ddye_016183 [Dipteronia dyeriana]